jgi:hypothetical protein
VLSGSGFATILMPGNQHLNGERICCKNQLLLMLSVDRNLSSGITPENRDIGHQLVSKGCAKERSASSA